jgi:hypothetical protein
MKFVSQIWSENSDKSQNKKIIESLLKLTFLSFSPNFGENFEMEFFFFFFNGRIFAYY